MSDGRFAVVIECKNCGAKNELTDDSKRWIIRIYEAATGKVLLPCRSAPQSGPTSPGG
jgi:hypothetical protein